MASRREFIQAGVAAAVLPQVVIGTEFTEGPGSSAATFYRVIFDYRFPASVRFAAEMRAQGAALHGIHGDITGLWFHDLYHRWKQGPAPIAGMTAHGALFCLERLAWDQGMRVLWRTGHPPADESEPLIEWTIGPKLRS